MATTSSTKTSSTKTSSSTSSSAAHKHADLEKEIASLARSLNALQARVSTAEAALAKPAQAGASAQKTDGVTRREWNLLLKKLGSYIGFRL